MTTTAPLSARGLGPLERLLRMLAIALLLAGAGSDAFAVNVSITSIQPVANEASLTPAVVQFNRDSNSGDLVVHFTLSGGAAEANSPTLPTYTTTSSATFALPAYATSGTITIANGHTFEQLVIIPLDNSSITGDLPLVVTVSTDPGGAYTVVQLASAAQIDIAEGDYQASVVVPAPVAYENTALVGSADDPNAPRRGILRVSFFPIATFPGSITSPGLTQLYLSPTTGAPPGLGATLSISPTASGGSFTTTTTAAAPFLTNGSGFIPFTPGISVGIPVGSIMTTSGGFSGHVALAPAPPLHTLHDKALKVQFGGSAALPLNATGATITGANTDTYYVTYKIGGSGMGSATNPANNGLGWNVVAYPGSLTTHPTTMVNLGVGTPLTAPAQVIIGGNTYTLMSDFGGAPGMMTLTSGLLTSVHDGDAVQKVGDVTYIGKVSSPVLAGTTSLIIENGSGSFAPGDVFTLAGEAATGARYVITNVQPGPLPSSTLSIDFRRYTAGTVGFAGVNTTHSALVPGSFPSPALSTVINVSDDAPFSQTLNLSATGGIIQLLIPQESSLVDFGINPIDDAHTDGRLSVSMSLFSDLNYAAATPTAGQVIIAEADSTASIHAAGNAVQGPTPTQGSFVIALTNPFSQAITVPFTITGSGLGVGQPGVDYTFSSPNNLTVDNGIYSVVIPANSTTATITVATLPTASLGVSGKTVTFTLSPTYDYLLAAASGNLNASATLSLLPPPPPVPQLSVVATRGAQQPLTFGALETTGVFTITALVAPVSDLTVQYALSGNAGPGTDYLIPPGYFVVSGTGTATILANTTSVTVVVDPNINPLPGYKAPDQATITLLPEGSYILPAPATSTATLTINQSQIVVTDVTSVPTTGTFNQNGAIDIVVNFSAPVTVLSGTPTLALNTGPTNAVINYVSGSGTSALVFHYVVGNGDVNPRLDYLSSGALVATPGTIVAATTPSRFNVSTALPPPGTTGSLFSDSTLNIDGAPTVALATNAPLHLNPTEVGLVAGHFTVTSSGAQTAPVTVFYTLGGNAVIGTDIAPPSGVAGQLVIPASATSATLVITPLANPVVNTAETVVMTLIAGPGYHLASAPTAPAALTDTLTVAQDRIGVLSVTSNTPNGTYHILDTITLAVAFSAPVDVTGSAQLALSPGTSPHATYVSGSGTSTLLFTYQVQYGDVSAHLDYASTIALTATLTDHNAGALTVYNTLPAPGTAGSLSANSALVIDGTPAIAIDPLQNTTPKELGLIPGGFVVTSTPAPLADLVVTYTIGGNAVIGTDIATPPPPFAAGTGQVTILAHQPSAALAVMPLANPVLNLNEQVVMTVVAGAGYHLAPAPAVTTSTLTVAQDRIGVLNVTSNSPNGTYHIGDTITLAVTFSAPVDVSGSAQLALSTGTSPLATYVSGSGSSTLLFTYQVGLDDISPHLDYASTIALTATLTDHNAGALPVSYTLPAPGAAGSLSANSALVIDGSPAIAIDPTQHVNPVELTAHPGQFVVTCTPAPAVDVIVTYTIGGSAVIGTDIATPPSPFTVGTATGQLTIPAGSASVPLVITPIDNTTLNLSETVVMTVVAGAGYHLAPTPAVTTDTLTVTQDRIVVTGVSAQPSSGTYHLGSLITIMVSFSEPVQATGTPTLALNTGATNAIATLAGGSASGSGTSTLNFTYVVGANDTSAHLDYLTSVSLATPGGSAISDPSTFALPVSTALALPGTHGSLAFNTTLVIDGSVPVVTAVSATTPDGTYTYGQSLTLTVTFSLPVNVSGTPELQLATGTTPAEASYAGGNGTSTLSFTYVVGANDASADLDCTSASALTLNGGSITWTGAGSVPAALALPVPGTAGSLGSNKALVIDGTLPKGKPPVGSITGPNAGTGGGCGLGSGVAGLVAALALCLRALGLRAATLRRHRRDQR
jgi:hypothetical protein